MLEFYKKLMAVSTPALQKILSKRALAGKEDRSRIRERTGQATRFRPKGKLVWFHAASVGEAQSTLVLMETLLGRFPDIHILVTTGTVTSAALLKKRLPPAAIHQFYPLDHPVWVKNFLDHWMPDAVLWMESELWPAMLDEIARRKIPAALVNARLSDRSYRRWRLTGRMPAKIMAAFTVILAQTDQDRSRLESLGASNVHVSDNLKYAAAPLPCDPAALEALRARIGNRPVWLYASTHDGEEALACRLHKTLEADFPGLLTIIVPRHPDRRNDILECVRKAGLNAALRSRAPLPNEKDQIYIADTLGELGLFYTLSPVSCIGRSFSSDGGGGHNPIEAARLGSAVLYGPHVQNLIQVFADMNKSGAARQVMTEQAFADTLRALLSDKAECEALRQRGLDFTQNQQDLIDKAFEMLDPILTAFHPQGLQACA